MADNNQKKKYKKPKHTRLVVPGDHGKGRRPTPRWEAPEDPFADADDGREEETSAFGPAPEPGEGLPPNAIPLPTRRKRRGLSPVRRKRRRRRILALAALVLAGVVLIVYQSGVYLTLGSLAGDWTDSLRAAVQPGDGFPMDFAMTGYLRSAPMGKSGFAALGARDMAFVSATGAELRRVQHTYPTPGFSAGDSRAVLYNRGGREYTVESRSKTLARRTTDQDILFAQMSPGGWLAVATTSRYRATLQVLGPTYDTGDPLLTWPLVDDKPILVAFQPNNKDLALGCLSVADGALCSTIYLLRTDRPDVQGTITEAGATLLKAEYMSDGKVLAVYDGFTAVYDSQGRAMVRYDYGGRHLLAADLAGGTVALVFGSTSQQTVTAALLDGQLNLQFELAVPAAGDPQVLAHEDGLFLLAGRELTARALNGTTETLTFDDARPLGLAHAPEPLVLVPGTALPLKDLLLPPEARPQPSSQAAAPGDESAPSPESGSASGSGSTPDSGSASGN